MPFYNWAADFIFRVSDFSRDGAELRLYAAMEKPGKTPAVSIDIPMELGYNITVMLASANITVNQLSTGDFYQGRGWI